MNLKYSLKNSYTIFVFFICLDVLAQKPLITDHSHTMLGLKKYHAMGYTGKGVTIAVLDNGFYKVDSIKAFEHLRNRNGILGTFDVIANDSNVFDRGSHGLYVLSTMVAFKKDSFVGSAPEANYLLVHTEDSRWEIHQEEQDWRTGALWAIENGADIINSSLGYSLFDSLEGDYAYQDMDGKTTLVTQAAEEASKNTLVVNSAGNAGNQPWYRITAPCDGPSVFCIGAVDSFGEVASFSSRGPSADGRIKPNVSAMGARVAFINRQGNIQKASGTSFSSPLISGMMACLKQAFPNASNHLLMRSVEQSTSHYLNPNDSIGYGIPNVLVADSILRCALASETTYIKKTAPLVFPNPSNAVVFVDHSHPLRLLELRNITGELVLTENKGQIDISSLSRGTYFLYIEDINQDFWVKKIQK